MVNLLIQITAIHLPIDNNLLFLGPEFEERIRGNEADNPKFNFLNPNDPYNAYYAHKLKEYQETDIADLRKKFETVVEKIFFLIIINRSGMKMF